MLFLSRKFWIAFINEPKTAIETLKKNKSIAAYRFAKFIIFLRIVFSEYWLNHCITRASALAFALLLTLIPLMASLSFMLATFVEIHPKQVESIITLFLPFAPPTILDHISGFFENAQKLRGIGIAFLIILAVGLFSTVEESLNTIWKVTRQRSFFNQLRTFTMVMVYGPFFFFASFSFRQSGWLDFVPDYFVVLDILPSLLVALGFTVLIWLMPNTKIRFRSALLGGLAAGALFELERWGFGTYIRLSIQTRTIYGAYGIFPFFLISLFFVSLFVLFGAEIAYVYQNFRPLLRSKKRYNRRIAEYRVYFSLRIMIDITSAFLKNQPPRELAYFTKQYELTVPQTSGIIQFLVNSGYIHIVNGKESGKEAFVPAYDVSKIMVNEFLRKIDQENHKIPATPEDPFKTHIADLMNNSGNNINPLIDDLSFKQLVEDEEKYRKKTIKAQ